MYEAQLVRMVYESQIGKRRASRYSLRSSLSNCRPLALPLRSRRAKRATDKIPLYLPMFTCDACTQVRPPFEVESKAPSAVIIQPSVGLTKSIVKASG